MPATPANNPEIVFLLCTPAMVGQPRKTEWLGGLNQYRARKLEVLEAMFLGAIGTASHLILGSVNPFILSPVNLGDGLLKYGTDPIQNHKGDSQYCPNVVPRDECHVLRSPHWCPVCASIGRQKHVEEKQISVFCRHAANIAE